MSTSPTPSDPAPDSPPLRIEMERRLDQVRNAATRLREFLAARRLSEKDIWACELAVVEACNNAVQHVSESAPPIRIEADVFGGEVQIRIFDGSSFEFPTAPELPASDQENGRGLYLIRSLMDQVRTERGDPSDLRSESCLLLRKALTGV